MAPLTHSLHVLVQHMDRHADRLLAEHGLTFRRYLTLVQLVDHPGASQRDLAASTGSSEAAASRLLRALADDGLVALDREPGAGNRRTVRLTDDGATRLAAAEATLGGPFDGLVTGLGIDAVALDRDLARIVAVLRES